MTAYTLVCVLRACVAAIAIGVLAGCIPVPQSGPMPVVCDEGVPPVVCTDMRDTWDLITELPRSQIVRIEVECIACGDRGADMLIRAVLTDGTTAELGVTVWEAAQPEPGSPSRR